MKMRYIFTIIGFIFRGFWGGFIGFILGSVLENILKSTSLRRSIENVLKNRIPTDEIELYLLALSASVIRSDGEVDASELNYVRTHFNQMLGAQRASELFRKYNFEVKNKNWSVQEVCQRINTHRVSYSTRLQIVYFLLGLAQSDGRVSTSELQQIHIIARGLHISDLDFERLKAMFFKGTTSFETGEDPYKILGVSPSSTDTEIKKAYRELAKKYHPDKLQSQSEALRKGAEEKFKKIQQAYEQILKERKR